MLLRVTIALLTTLIVTVSPAQAQSFPSKSVNIVVPFTPGGVTDILARALAQELGTLWKQTVTVENLPGGGTVIGVNKLLNSPADGHTLIVTTDPTVVANRYLYKKLAYDPDKSLVPISMIARSGQLVVAHPSFPVNSLREMVEAARRAPGTVSYSSTGKGTGNFMLFEAVAKHEGVQFLHVPYKGISPATTAVMSGEVNLSMVTPSVIGALVKSGKVKALAISSAQRSSSYPDVPTMAELGFGYAAPVIWWGVFAAAGTPAALVDKINGDVRTVARNPEFIKKYIAPNQLDLVANTPSEFAQVIRADIKHVGEMVKAAGIQPE